MIPESQSPSCLVVASFAAASVSLSAAAVLTATSAIVIATLQLLQTCHQAHQTEGPESS